MPRAGSYQTEAIVIKKTRLGEADRILTFYTPDMGKIQAVAKGVRRPKAKLSGHLELLTYSRVLLTKGRNLDTITGCQAIESFLPLKTDLDLCACGLYATELVHQFGVERQENRPLFDLFLALLRELSGQRDDGAPGRLLRYFEIQLLNLVGYAPQLRQCVSCRQTLPETNVYFSLASGGAICPHCRASQGYAYPLSYPGLTRLRDLQQDDWPSEARTSDTRADREIEMLLRSYFRYLLERDVRSVAWLDALRHTPPKNSNHGPQHVAINDQNPPS